MRFLLDANLPQGLCHDLAREFSVDVYRAASSLSDEQILHQARKENRILLTLDTDFLNILQYPPGTHEGIVVFRLKNQKRTQVVAIVLNFFDTFKNQFHLLKGNSTVVRETSFKIHQPVKK